MKKVYAAKIGKSYFSNPVDILPAELGQHFDLENTDIYSDIELPNSSNINLDFPTPEPYFMKNIDKIWNCKLNKTNYPEILPIYMRATYADGKVQ
jgi:hypothetical protein